MLARYRSRVLLIACLLVAGCPEDDPPSDESPDAGAEDASTSPDSGQPADSGAPDSGPECDGTGKPELTGPITGLKASYAAGDPIDVTVSVDEDTARVRVGVYEVGSELYLGGTAEDLEGSQTIQLSLFAGVVNGATGTFYLDVELCSTSVCTTPFVRNTYQRADRTTAPLADGETYVATRENVGDTDLTEVCPTSIPIQSFEIE